MGEIYRPVDPLRERGRGPIITRAELIVVAVTAVFWLTNLEGLSLHSLDRIGAHQRSFELIALLATLISKEADSYSHIPVRRLLEYRKSKQGEY